MRLATRLPRATSLGEDRAAQAEVGVVGERYRFVVVLDPEEQRDRTEEFFDEGGVVGLDVAEDRRLHEGAGAVDAAAAHDDGGPLGDGAVDLVLQVGQRGLRGQRARVVDSSIGSPGLSAASAAWNLSRKRSASDSTTMKRLAATQDCPVLLIFAHTAHLTAPSRSASSSTMKASLPPSSIVDFFRFCPARPATTFRLRCSP